MCENPEEGGTYPPCDDANGSIFLTHNIFVAQLQICFLKVPDFVNRALL